MRTIMQGISLMHPVTMKLITVIPMSRVVGNLSINVMMAVGRFPGTSNLHFQAPSNIIAG